MSERRISDLFAERKRPLLSFEFFPPKDEAALGPLRETARQLSALKPDFVTVTYGAGGSTRERTLRVCHLLREEGFGPVMPHLTCVGASRAELRQLADELHRGGFRNIMALRGDPPKGDTTFRPAADGLAHAAELVVLLKQQHDDFCCGVACYPETHPEAVSPEEDLRHFADKMAAGGDFGTTQLFFDNAAYFRFVEKARAAGVSRPILPGLLPAISLKQVQRMCVMCQTALPPQLAASLEAAGGDGEAAELVGLRWAERQIDELLAADAPGIHLYILNRAKAALSRELVRFFENRA